MGNPMTADLYAAARPDLATLRALLDAATPGPWRTVPSQDSSPDTAQDVGIVADALGTAVPGVRFPLIGEVWAERVRGRFDGGAAQRDAALIVAAVNTLPALLSEIERRGDDLGAAWAAAEAALPVAGWAESDGRWVVPDGVWDINVRHYPADGDGVHEPHYPDGYEATAEIHPHKRFVGNHADSPAAALHALAAALTEGSR